MDQVAVGRRFEPADVAPLKTAIWNVARSDHVKITRGFLFEVYVKK